MHCRECLDSRITANSEKLAFQASTITACTGGVMAYNDLREFIKALEEAGGLITIDAPVSTDLEIAEITDRVSKGPAAQNKALLFTNVRGYEMPVLINAFGSERRIKMSLECENL